MCVLNDKMFVPSNQNSVVDCIDLKDFKKIASLEPASKTEKYGMLMRIQLLNDNLLLISYENGDLALFDINNFKELSRLSIFKGNPLLSFDYSIDKNIGVAGCSELDLQQFTINERCLKLLNESISLKNPGLNYIKIRSSDGKIFAVAGWDSRVRLYSLKKAKLLCVLDFHNENVNCLDFSKNNVLVCGSNDGLISFWNLYN
jgi:WD40 repeat protein